MNISQPINHGKRWTEEDENIITEKHTLGMKIEDIANLLGRSICSIICKLFDKKIISSSEKDSLAKQYNINTNFSQPKPKFKLQQNYFQAVTQPNINDEKVIEKIDLISNYENMLANYLNERFGVFYDIEDDFLPINSQEQLDEMIGIFSKCRPLGRWPACWTYDVDSDFYRRVFSAKVGNTSQDFFFWR